jgi:hypothetical protein
MVAPRSLQRCRVLLAALCALCALAAAHALKGDTESGFITFDAVRGRPYNVSYDGRRAPLHWRNSSKRADKHRCDRRSLMLNGARSLFVSGAAHYPRATPAMWPAIAANAKKLGLNMIEARDAMRLRSTLAAREC